MGENFTEAAQLAETANVVPQVLAEIEKSPGFVPVKDSAIPVRVAVPVLVNVTVDADEVCPTVKLPNDTEVGLKEAAGETPVPLTGTVWGEPDALSVRVKVPERVPVVVGVNVTVYTQEALGASVVPHGELTWKSPLTVAEVILRVAVPVFVRVIVCPALVVPTNCEENVKLVGARDAMGAPETPVPVKLDVCGLPGALSTTNNVALRAPVAIGANWMPMVQEDPLVSVAPQLFVWVKSPGFVEPEAALNVAICITQSADDVVAVALLLPATVVDLSSAISASGVVIMRVVNPLPGAVKCDPVVPAPKINSLAAVVVADPLLAAVPVPNAPTATSKGLAVSIPLYSKILTSGNVAAPLNVTVTVLLPAAMFLA